MRSLTFKLFAAFILLAGMVNLTEAQPTPDISVDLVAYLYERLPKNAGEGQRVSTPTEAFAKFCSIESDPVARRVFTEYGAMYAAAETVTPPDRCIFAKEAEVQEFQKGLKTKIAPIGLQAIELQEAAMDSLLAAQKEANAAGLQIIPLDGAIAGRRSYHDTVRLWNSRFVRALKYWVARGSIPKDIAETVVVADTRTQIERVVEWESRGFYFSTDMTRTIFSSTAPPGSSQHLAMLAFDLEGYGDARVRQILNSHGWFQTIVNDAPHFTYLGLKRDELTSRGLRPVRRGGFEFWVPRLNTR